MEEYLSALPKECMKTVKANNNTNFASHFSDGKESKVIRNVVNPVAIRNKQYVMWIDVKKIFASVDQ